MQNVYIELEEWPYSAAILLVSFVVHGTFPCMVHQRPQYCFQVASHETPYNFQLIFLVYVIFLIIIWIYIEKRSSDNV